MEKNKKILLIVGVIAVIGISFFAYQNYFNMPEFENKTLTNGLKISAPVGSNFIDIGNNTFHDDKTNLNIKLLKSENDIIDSKVTNPKETIKNGSNTIKVFENYLVVSDKNNEYGVKISNITDSNRKISREIAENTVLSSSLKAVKISEEKAREIAQKGMDEILQTSQNGFQRSSELNDLSLIKFNGKTTYKASFSIQTDVSNLGFGSVKGSADLYIDAYNGKIFYKNIDAF